MSYFVFSQNFKQLHEAILTAYGFDKKHQATFYRSNEDWKRGREISLEEYDKAYKVKPLLMEETKIGNEIFSTNQKFIYEYDFAKNWVFYVDLIAIDKAENKDKIYVPFKDKAVIYNGKRFDLIVIDYFSVNPELLAKIKSTPYAALLSLNEDFYNTEMEGEEYLFKAPKVAKLDPYAYLYAKIVINHRQIFCYLAPDNFKVGGVGFHFDTKDNGKKSMEFIALDLDDIGGDNIVVDKHNPLFVKLESIKRSIRVNAYSVGEESINDDIIDILTY